MHLKFFICIFSLIENMHLEKDIRGNVRKILKDILKDFFGGTLSEVRTSN